MLRQILLAASLVLMGAGAAGLLTGLFYPAALWMLGTGALLAIGIAYERVRYKPIEKGRPGPGWERTSERFVDDETGKTVTVYIRPETGERMYVED